MFRQGEQGLAGPSGLPLAARKCSDGQPGAERWERSEAVLSRLSGVERFCRAGRAMVRAGVWARTSPPFRPKNSPG